MCVCGARVLAILADVNGLTDVMSTLADVYGLTDVVSTLGDVYGLTYVMFVYTWRRLQPN